MYGAIKWCWMHSYDEVIQGSYNTIGVQFTEANKGATGAANARKWLLCSSIRVHVLVAFIASPMGSTTARLQHAVHFLGVGTLAMNCKGTGITPVQISIAFTAVQAIFLVSASEFGQDPVTLFRGDCPAAAAAARWISLGTTGSPSSRGHGIVQFFRGGNPLGDLFQRRYLNGFMGLYDARSGRDKGSMVGT